MLRWTWKELKAGVKSLWGFVVMVWIEIICSGVFFRNLPALDEVNMPGHHQDSFFKAPSLVQSTSLSLSSANFLIHMQKHQSVPEPYFFGIKVKNYSCGSFINSWIRSGFESNIHSLTLTHVRRFSPCIPTWSHKAIWQWQLISYAFFVWICWKGICSRVVDFVHLSVTRHPACLRGISVLISWYSEAKIPNLWIRTVCFNAIQDFPKQ